MPYSYECLAIVLLTLHCLQAGSLRPEAGKADEDKCDRQLQALEGSLSQACQNLPNKQNNCRRDAHDAMKFSAIYLWMRHMVIPDLSPTFADRYFFRFRGFRLTQLLNMFLFRESCKRVEVALHSCFVGRVSRDGQERTSNTRRPSKLRAQGERHLRCP